VWVQEEEEEEEEEEEVKDWYHNMHIPKYLKCYYVRRK
jgi:hypothetical protein